MVPPGIVKHKSSSLLELILNMGTEYIWHWGVFCMHNKIEIEASKKLQGATYVTLASLFVQKTVNYRVVE